MLKAVIYDLDGTLIDSRQDLVDSVNALLVEQGVAPLADALIASFVGEGASLLVSRSLAAASRSSAAVAHAPASAALGLEARLPELLPRWFQLYGERQLRTTRAYDGIAALLEEPPDARAVLTNKPGRFARDILSGLHLSGRFRAVLGGDDAPRKPSPEGLLKLCEQLGARSSEALLVGDSAVDAATGAAAGVAVCAVLWGFGAEAELRALRTAYVCAAPSELRALLQRLRSAA